MAFAARFVRGGSTRDGGSSRKRDFDPEERKRQLLVELESLRQRLHGAEGRLRKADHSLQPQQR